MTTIPIVSSMYLAYLRARRNQAYKRERRIAADAQEHQLTCMKCRSPLEKCEVGLRLEQAELDAWAKSDMADEMVCDAEQLRMAQIHPNIDIERA